MKTFEAKPMPFPRIFDPFLKMLNFIANDGTIWMVFGVTRNRRAWLIDPMGDMLLESFYILRRDYTPIFVGS